MQPTRCVGLVKWVRAVLTQHTALLMSQPELVRSLTPLYQVSLSLSLSLERTRARARARSRALALSRALMMLCCCK